MNRAEIINRLIQRYDYKSYLEIGLSNGDCHKQIQCEKKVSVDPEPQAKADYIMTSDEFFKQNKDKFDIVFIDGKHEADFCSRDIENALEVLNEGGTIVCHDMNPIGFQEQFVPRAQQRWNGDVWKSFVALRATRDDLEMYVIATDEGCGIIRRGKQEKLDIEGELTYDRFDQNRIEWLNLQPIAYFLHQLQ